MAKFTAPKLRSSLFYVLFSSVSVVFFSWMYFIDKSSSRNGIMIFGIIWILFILFAWFWVGNFAKQVNVENDNLVATLQNGKQFQLSFTSLKQVKLVKRLGYYEVILIDNVGTKIIVTSHIDKFADFVKIFVDRNFLNE